MFFRFLPERWRQFLRPNLSEFTEWFSSFEGIVVILILRLPVWSYGLFAFAFYWGVPLVICFIEGTLFSIESAVNIESRFPNVLSMHSIIDSVRAEQEISNGTAYLNDLTHLFFSILLIPGGYLAGLILRTIRPVMDKLNKDNILAKDRLSQLQLYHRFRRIATSWPSRLVSFAFGMIALIVFISISQSPEFTTWWGNSIHGIAGYYFSVIVGLVIFAGTMALTNLVFISIFLVKVIPGGFNLNLFHPDGCNGLSPLGKVIFVYWLFAVFLGSEMFITVYFGYFGLERLFFVWILVVMGLVAIPIIALLPLLYSLRSLQEIRVNKLNKISPILNELLKEVEDHIEGRDYEQALKKSNLINEFKEIHSFVFQMNVFPFNPRALALVSVIYAVQVLFTVYQLVS